MTDDRTTDADGLLAGRLEGISVPDLLWALSSRRRTGTLTVSGGGTETTVYFDGGRIIFATSSDPDNRLGERLLREGDIRLDDLEEALVKLGSGKRLGTLLVEAGRLTAGRLVDAVLGQVHGIVLDLFDRDEGDYRFEDGTLPTEEVITLGTRTEELLLQGIRRVQSYSRIRRSVGPLRTVYGLTDTWREALTGLGVTEGERRIAVVLERGDATVDTLCSEVYLSNFEVYQALWAFKVIGVVSERGTAIEDRRDAVHEGRLSRRDFARVIIGFHRERSTGVLHVAHGQRERTFHLHDGKLVFATSNDIDDGLVAYLLRRGVISLRHREEIARRLLSNRRVGTILSELGVISASELAPMVRQHLTEIVHDTFGWSAGEWAFVPGPLPSVEEIALEATVEALVAGGLRRVRSWTRVLEGCGGLDATLELTPEYLEVLDAIGAGPEEWAVVTALKTPKTPRALCRLLPGADHRTCKLLWVLRVLGAVRVSRRAEADEPARDSRDEPAAAADVEATAVAAGTVAVEAGAEDEAGETDASPDVEEPAAVAGAAASDAEHDEVADVDEPEPTSAEAVAAADGPDAADAGSAPAAFELDEPGAGVMPFDDQPSPDDDAPTAIPVAVDDAGGDDDAARAATDDERPWEPLDVRTDAADVEPAETVEDAAEQDSDATPALEDAEVAESAEAARADDDDIDTDEARLDPDATQVLDRDAVAQALDGEPAATVAGDDEGGPDAVVGDDAPDDDGPALAELDPDSTQVLDRAAVAQAMGDDGDDGDDDPTLSIDREPIDHEDDAGDTDRTQRIDPSDVEAVAAGPAWEPPADLDRVIERFNAVQRLLYRAIRAEVGAGASNLIRACCGQIDGDASALEDAELRADGTWDVDSLRRGVEACRLDDPWATYHALIEREIDLLRMHVGDARAAELERHVERLERQDAHA